MADPKKLADALTQDQLLAQFNRREGEAQPWYMKPMDMEGRATFLPFKDTLPGSVMNQRELALPGLLAGAVNAFTAPGRVSTQGFDAPEEAQNLAMNVMGGGITTGKMMRNPTGVGGTDLALNVYHGTPNEIKGKFDLTKVGTGAGTSSYGHGIYSTESLDLATQFKNLHKQFDANNKKEGYLYKLNINDKVIPFMVDFYEKIDNQPKILQIIRDSISDLKKLESFDKNVSYGNMTGNDAFNYIQGKTDKIKAQNALKLGIKGIKYTKQNTTNYVNFDPNDISIIEKNAVPVTRKKLLQQEFDKLDK